jgi:hypothetical protein
MVQFGPALQPFDASVKTAFSEFLRIHHHLTFSKIKMSCAIMAYLHGFFKVFENSFFY